MEPSGMILHTIGKVHAPIRPHIHLHFYILSNYSYLTGINKLHTAWPRMIQILNLIISGLGGGEVSSGENMDQSILEENE